MAWYGMVWHGMIWQCHPHTMETLGWPTQYRYSTTDYLMWQIPKKLATHAAIFFLGLLFLLGFAGAAARAGGVATVCVALQGITCTGTARTYSV